jgi:hypothetical protein
VRFNSRSEGTWERRNSIATPRHFICL